MAEKMKGSLVENLKKIAEKFPARVSQALYAEAQIIMTEAKRRTPVTPSAAVLRSLGRSLPKGHAPGTLRASGTVGEPKRLGDGNITVSLSFGGAARAYAAVQHERLDFYHTIGEAKYLEGPMNEARPNLAARIAQRIKF